MSLEDEIQKDDFNEERIPTLRKNKNFWVFTASMYFFIAFFVIISFYMPLYLRDIGIDYLNIGIALGLFSLIAIPGQIMSGYIADNYNRRNLSALSILLYGICTLILAFASDFTQVVIAILFYGAGQFTNSAGPTYVMSVIRKNQSGVAFTLQQIGQILQIIPLIGISLLMAGGSTFLLAVKAVLLFGSVFYFLSALMRVKLLDNIEFENTDKISKSGFLRNFISQNKSTFSMWRNILPMFLLLIVYDAISDAFYNYGVLLYINDTLGISIDILNTMVILAIAIGIPVALIVARKLDSDSSKWNGIMIGLYSLLPIAMILLLMAPLFPYYGPFIALLLKSVNEFVWYIVILTYLQKFVSTQEYGRMISLMTILVLIISTLVSLISGIVYSLFSGVPLIIGILVINVLMILSILKIGMTPRNMNT